MAQSSFLNPFIPFVVQIQNGLRQGTLISVQGTSFPSSNRVCLNLQVGPNIAPRDSVALHVALDYTRNLIVRNSIQGPNWGVEESHGPPIALIKGQWFKLDILCDTHEYKIAFNGSHFGEMKHRIPFQSVFYLAVDGEAQLHNIQINSGDPTTLMPGQMPMFKNPSSYMQSAEQMPIRGAFGCVLPHSIGYNTYPGQSHNSPYLQKKAAKAQQKHAKKALKYGVPAVGFDEFGIGAYAEYNAHKHKECNHKKGSKSIMSHYNKKIRKFQCKQAKKTLKYGFLATRGDGAGGCSKNKVFKHKGYNHKKGSKSFMSHCGLRKLNNNKHKKNAAKHQHKQAKNAFKNGAHVPGSYTVLTIGSSSE